MATISEAWAIAVTQHGAGRLQEAEQACRQILAVAPNQPDVWHFLGVIANQSGRPQEAIQYIGHALKLRPDWADAYFNLGGIFKNQKMLDDAASCYRRAIEVKSDFAEAHANLGEILYERGNLPEAIASLRRAVELKPDLAEVQNNLGAMLHQQGDFANAVVSYRRALERKPDYGVAYFNLANALRDQGQQQEAIGAYRSALTLNPDFAEAYANLGNVLADSRQLSEAAACFQRAIQLKPGLADAHNSLGTVLYDQGRPADAAACYRRAIELSPNYAEAHSNVGAALKDLGQLDEAIAHHRLAVALQPNSADAHNNLGNTFRDLRNPDEAIASYRRALELKPDYALAHRNLGHAFTDQGKLDEAVASFRRALELKPDYALAHCNLGNAFKDQGKLEEAVACYRRALELKPDCAEAYDNLLNTLHFCLGYDAKSIYDEHRRWNQQFAEPLAEFIQPHSNERSTARRLRIGYVSPDFRNHCQAFFTTPLFSSHDHQAFEIFCYADVARPDSITARLRSYADTWRDITGLSDEQVAQLVRQDQIDILVDLTMHMAYCRPLVFARKPAPVQVCWLAYPGTTGLSTIDYRLTDPYLDPAGLFDRHYSEESVRLPDTFWCYDPLTDKPAVNSLPARQNGYITFGSLNNYCKVNPAVLRLWGRVIKSVEGSRLMLLSPEGSHRQTALDVLLAEGIEPSRVTFVSPRPRAHYLELYHQIDIGLDPFPANGHTTSLDSFWMGVPVVTIIGSTVLGRAGVSQLNNLGLQALIGDTPDKFVLIATELAADLDRLGDLRANLRSRMQSSPLMDAPRFARNMESTYRWMWQRWCHKS